MLIFLTAGAGRRQIGRASFRLSNVSINAKSVLQWIDELEPLAILMPTNPKEREKYVQFLSCLLELYPTLISIVLTL